MAISEFTDLKRTITNTWKPTKVVEENLNLYDYDDNELYSVVYLKERPVNSLDSTVYVGLDDVTSFDNLFKVTLINSYDENSKIELQYSVTLDTLTRNGFFVDDEMGRIVFLKRYYNPNYFKCNIEYYGLGSIVRAEVFNSLVGRLVVDSSLEETELDELTTYEVGTILVIPSLKKSYILVYKSERRAVWLPLGSSRLGSEIEGTYINMSKTGGIEFYVSNARVGKFDCRKELLLETPSIIQTTSPEGYNRFLFVDDTSGIIRSRNICWNDIYGRPESFNLSFEMPLYNEDSTIKHSLSRGYKHVPDDGVVSDKNRFLVTTTQPGVYTWNHVDSTMLGLHASAPLYIEDDTNNGRIHIYHDPTSLHLFPCNVGQSDRYLYSYDVQNSNYEWVSIDALSGIVNIASSDNIINVNYNEEQGYLISHVTSYKHLPTINNSGSFLKTYFSNNRYDTSWAQLNLTNLNIALSNPLRTLDGTTICIDTSGLITTSLIAGSNINIDISNNKGLISVIDDITSINSMRLRHTSIAPDYTAGNSFYITRSVFGITQSHVYTDSDHTNLSTVLIDAMRGGKNTATICLAYSRPMGKSDKTSADSTTRAINIAGFTGGGYSDSGDTTYYISNMFGIDMGSCGNSTYVKYASAIRVSGTKSFFGSTGIYLSGILTELNTSDMTSGMTGYSRGLYITDLVTTLNGTDTNRYANAHGIDIGNLYGTTVARAINVTDLSSVNTVAGLTLRTLKSSTVYAFDTSTLYGTSQACAINVLDVSSANSSIGMKIQKVQTSQSSYGLYISDITGTGTDSTVSNYGLYVSDITGTGTGTLVTNYGLYVSDITGSGIGISNYGLYIRNIRGTGTLVTNYGLYVSDISGASINYGLYITNISGGTINKAIYSSGVSHFVSNYILFSNSTNSYFYRAVSGTNIPILDETNYMFLQISAADSANYQKVDLGLRLSLTSSTRTTKLWDIRNLYLANRLFYTNDNYYSYSSADLAFYSYKYSTSTDNTIGMLSVPAAILSSKGNLEIPGALISRTLIQSRIWYTVLNCFKNSNGVFLGDMSLSSNRWSVYSSSNATFSQTTDATLANFDRSLYTFLPSDSSFLFGYDNTCCLYVTSNITNSGYVVLYVKSIDSSSMPLIPGEVYQISFLARNTNTIDTSCLVPTGIVIWDRSADYTHNATFNRVVAGNFDSSVPVSSLGTTWKLRRIIFTVPHDIKPVYNSTSWSLGIILKTDSTSSDTTKSVYITHVDARRLSATDVDYFQTSTIWADKVTLSSPNLEINGLRIVTDFQKQGTAYSRPSTLLVAPRGDTTNEVGVYLCVDVDNTTRWIKLNGTFDSTPPTST